MPNDIVIRVENLSKRYQLGQLHNDLLSEKLMHGLRRLASFRPFRRSAKSEIRDKGFMGEEAEGIYGKGKSYQSRVSDSHESPVRNSESDILPPQSEISTQSRQGAETQSKDDTSTSAPSRLCSSAPLRSQIRNAVPDSQSEIRNSIWALKDVSFEVKRGEVLGIIGRNGAGKSTLLKILSRITEPTEGRVVVKGRVGSLLEVGTGFHPELTGRENIFLNGAILGMRKAEIQHKFHEIVAFAEVANFIDTPVKRYSSGMYVRLAFAVAAHLDPEILLVDEVLAVGDITFQQKCLGKMDDVARRGRTVLFVSHNMGTIQQLCRSAMLIQSGSLLELGATETIIASYLRDAAHSQDGHFDLSNHPSRPVQHEPIIQRLTLRSADGSPTTHFYPDSSVEIELLLESSTPIKDPRPAVAIEDSYGRRIMTLAPHFQNQRMPDIERRCRFKCILPQLRLGSGHYLVSVSVGTKYSPLIDSVNNGAWFEVDWRNNYSNGEPYYPVYGPVLARSIWQRID